MPKMKTHRAGAKRYRLTGTGKLTHDQANRHHKNHKKRSNRLRRLDGAEMVSPADVKKVKRELGL
jgi:large subunit ribosomal protein L35